MSTFGMVLTDNAGNQYFVQANPGFVSLTGSNAINGTLVSVTTTNTAQRMPNQSAKQVVTLIAAKGNTGTVYVGAANTVTNTAYMVALDPKDSYDFPITNADLLWIYGTAGDGVSYVAV